MNTKVEWCARRQTFANYSTHSQLSINGKIKCIHYIHPQRKTAEKNKNNSDKQAYVKMLNTTNLVPEEEVVGRL